MRPLFRLLSPSGRRCRLQVFVFHRVLPRIDPLFPDDIDAARFDNICRWLREWFDVLPLDQAVRRLRDASLPACAAAITFDDGYADNHEVALPVLQRHGLSATFFVATGFLDGGCMWNDRIIAAIRQCRLDLLTLDDLAWPGIGGFELGSADHRRRCIVALIDHIKYLGPKEREAAVVEVARRAGAGSPASPMMRSVQVRALAAAGMGIGAHTVSHPILAQLDAAAALDEIGQSRRVLQALVDAPIPLFAYPNGKPGIDYSADNARQVRQLGFEAAVSTGWGAAGPGSDIHQLPRFTPWDRSRARFALRLAGNYLRRPGGDSLVTPPA